MSLKIKSVEILPEYQVFSTNVNDNTNYISKGNIINKNCLIDEDYQGIWHIDIHNISKNTAKISAGDKLAQFVMYKVEYPITEVVESEDILFNNTTSERGSGAFGSTGIN